MCNAHLIAYYRHKLYIFSLLAWPRARATAKECLEREIFVQKAWIRAERLRREALDNPLGMA